MKIANSAFLLSVMAGEEKGLSQPICLLLVFGIPASGKTFLSRSILDHVSKEGQSEWTWLAIHFDDFYPPDSRSKPVSPPLGLKKSAILIRPIGVCFW